MAEPPFNGQDDRPPGAGPRPRGPRRARSVIPEVPLRREFDGGPAPSSGRGILFRAVVVYGGLALIFAITLLAEAHLAERERQGLEQQALQTASLSGAPVDRPMERLATTKHQVASIREDFGVEVHFLYGAKQYFPDFMRSPPASAKGAQVPLDEFEQVLPAVRAALERYPKPVLRDNLSDIYLVSDLSLYGKGYGGTYEASTIYINTQGATALYGDLEIHATLHHELSSILMYNYDFPFAAWRAVNDPAFVYPNNAFDMLDSDEGLAFDGGLLEGGFLSGYARSDIENDINVMAEWLLTQPTSLQALAARHDRIARKMRIAQDFYQDIDPAIPIQ